MGPMLVSSTAEVGRNPRVVSAATIGVGGEKFYSMTASVLEIVEDAIDVRDAINAEARAEAEGTISWDRIKEEFGL